MAIKEKNTVIIIRVASVLFGVSFGILILVWCLMMFMNDLSINLDHLILIHDSKMVVAVDLLMVAVSVVSYFFYKSYFKYLFSVKSQLKKTEKVINNVIDLSEKIKVGDYLWKIDEEEEHELMHAIGSMRDSLQAVAKEDEERNWILNGSSKISEILRNSNDLVEISYDTIKQVVDIIDAVQGAFYVVSEEEGEGKEKFVEMISSYAYNRRKYINSKFKIGEGLVGQSILEKDTVHRTEIPKDYVTITSGILGDNRPSALLFVPLITEGEVFGVIEIASFKQFSELQIKFLETLSDVIARTLFNIRANEKNLKLLEEVNRSQKRTNVLLENASEVITVYDKDKQIKYVSPSIINILGYHPEEMLGQNDFDKIHEDGLKEVEEMFAKLLESPDQQIVTQFSYLQHDGDRVWLEARGVNLLEDPSIEGIVVNSRDITERLANEKEQRIRAKMQALSENSPDLIMRFEVNGTVSYVNPEISNLTQFTPEEIVGKIYSDLELDEAIINSWKTIIEDIKQTPENILKEELLPTVKGDQIFEVNAIPEYDEYSVLESILVVSHDITEAKKQEIAVMEANKKVTGSINYGLSIQKAILPDMAMVQDDFKDSFQLYLPRDTVSGDFPWYYKKGDDIYYAVCDCTGHGVPGCMLSLVGYCLFESTMIQHDISDAATLLHHLHDGMVATLRQEQSDSSDGMDVGLCKINLKEKTLQYAGAHRPLLFMREGEIEVIKGDSFPIGGVQYGGRQKFTNYDINFKEGDCIFYFSDGYPDQNGGPKGKKFMNKPIRNMFVENKDKSMVEIHDVFRDRLFEWMEEGNKIQVDDVLMVGIRF